MQFWPSRTRIPHAVDLERVWDVASFRRDYFKPAFTAAKLRVCDLRHAAASLWLAAGFPPHQVSRWLGHASVVMTDTIYSNLYPTDQSQYKACLEALAAKS